MTSLVFLRAAVGVFIFPTAGLYVDYLKWVKTAETPIYCARLYFVHLTDKKEVCQTRYKAVPLFPLNIKHIGPMILYVIR